MVNKILSILGKGFSGLVIVIASTCVLTAAAPPGWHIAGSNRTDYESDVDPMAAYNGHPSAYLRSRRPFVEGFGTLMQSFRADHYLGKRVRLSAFVRTEGVQGSAGLWMRVDRGGKPVEFDNMQNRPIEGTTAWRKYEVVLDVPPGATGIFFGILLGQSGTVWINSVELEVVSTAVPVTGKWTPPPYSSTRAKAVPVSREGRALPLPEEPRNLDFEMH